MSFLNSTHKVHLRKLGISLLKVMREEEMELDLSRLLSEVPYHIIEEFLKNRGYLVYPDYETLLDENPQLEDIENTKEV